MTIRARTLMLAVPAAAGLAGPPSAGAACAQQSLAKLARDVPVVVTATAQPGPMASNGVGLLSPATFRVIAYDQGTGPGTLPVQTALTQGPDGLAAVSEGVNPMSGQTWRLWGTIGADGALQTNVCLGSRLRGAESSPTIAVGSKRATLRSANFAGTAHQGSLPTVSVRKTARVVLKVAAREANFPVSKALANSLVTVRLRTGTRTRTVTMRWKASDGTLSARLAGPRRGSATLIVITQAGSYAARLRAG